MLGIPNMATYMTQSGRPYQLTAEGRRKYLAPAATTVAATTSVRRRKVPAKRTRAAPQVVYRSLPAPVVHPAAITSLPPPITAEVDPWVDYGGKAGRAVGSFAKGILGFGAYTIKKNVLMGRLPKVMNIPQGGGTVIRFQEYLGDILTSSVANTFDITAFDINAGLFETFPWLSQIAMNYEQYSFEGLLFEFRSTSADALNSTNTALGSVIMATNYDSSDPNFGSKGEMLNYEFSTSVKPAESCMHMVECAPRQTVLTELYTRSGAVPNGDDQRFYDLGKFQIATAGFQGTSVNVGELHCTYQVRLLKPKLHEALGQSIGWARITNATGVTALAPLGTDGSETESSTNTLAVHFVSSTRAELPSTNVIQTYLVQYRVLGTVAGAIVYPVITLTNAAFATEPPQFTSPPAATASISMEHNFTIITTPNGNTVAITFGVAGTFPTGTVSMSLFVQQVPNSTAV